MAQRAAAIIEHEPDLSLTEVVLVKTYYVLTSVYSVPREVVVDHLIALVSKRNVGPFGRDKGAVIQGLLMCRPSGRESIADAMIWAAAWGTPQSAVYTFDRRFPGEGITLRG